MTRFYRRVLSTWFSSLFPEIWWELVASKLPNSTKIGKISTILFLFLLRYFSYTINLLIAYDENTFIMLRMEHFATYRVNAKGEIDVTT